MAMMKISASFPPCVGRPWSNLLLLKVRFVAGFKHRGLLIVRNMINYS